jgi:hypothetical protein
VRNQNAEPVAVYTILTLVRQSELGESGLVGNR